jgi:hypothetical protein
VLIRRLSRTVVTLGLGCFAALAAPGAAAVADTAEPPETTVCFDAALARGRTEIDADLTVPQFDPVLGTLLEITVTGPGTHLDTDAAFESIAASPVTFAEHMDYQVMGASPGGLASPAPISGTITRIPSQALGAFDGTLDYLGVSAVTQPSIARDDTAGTVGSTAPAVLAAFTGSGSMSFHLTSTISETFTGGGGNVQATINTFMSATVRVCYRYVVPVEVGGVPPSRRSERPRLAFTGSADGSLAGSGALLLAVGAVLAWRARGPRRTLDT